MLTDRQIERMLGKLVRLENTLEGLLFEKVDEIEMKALHTDGSYHTIPEENLFSPCYSGDTWEGEGSYCWFLGKYKVDEKLAGKTLYIYPKIDGYEGLLWVNGKPFGNFSSKLIVQSHGNHYCNMLKQKVDPNETIDIALEYYANHYIIGTKPFEVNPKKDFKIIYNGVDICIKNERVWDIYFNLRIVNQMVQVLDNNSYRRAKLINVLKNVHEIVYYDIDSVDKDVFYDCLEKANILLLDVLKDTNSATVPFAGFIGHSHMDTAWLWDQKETLKKCARTYSNQISLMEQYPEYIFMQSSAYHSAIIKENYPELFEDMKKMIAEGRYEPNGGVWIECDCNIPSGEYMIRQFLWGQRFTREHFNYTSDSFWLPDTFGYSVSLPQIMKGCGVKYFLTTKLAWGDTTDFPYDTFYWKGLDGTKVLVHMNKTHLWPDPKTMKEFILGDGKNSIMEKTVSNMRLLSYGYGDGGGGPEFEMIEMANRLKDVEGLPKSSHITVSEFMNRLEDSLQDPSTYSGELYLELHRGTLTNQHTIKKNNRLAEIALRDLEYVTVRNAVKNGVEASGHKIHPLMNTLLVNQFHDILPGTCIPSAHDQALEEMAEVIEQAKDQLNQLLNSEQEEAAVDISKQNLSVTVINTLSFDRDDVLYIDYVDGHIVKGDYKQQIVTDLEGHKKLAIMGVVIPAFASITLELIPGYPVKDSAFTLEDNKLSTPCLLAEFNEKGYIESLIDKRLQREIRGEGYALNTFLIAEDVPEDWDNWDLDADYECKLRDSAKLISRNVVSEGEVEYRIRSKYQITANSTIIQDMIFYADSMEVRFDTKMDWQDDHRFLKTAFDTTIHTDFANQEVQFGYIKRPTNRNTAVEKAKFEVSNQKYTDLSETRYGAAILNDCKYGISVHESQMRLSLHKGGSRPDYRGDKGLHTCKYALLPHAEGFGAKSVIQPAYMFNVQPLIVQGNRQEESFLRIDADNIIVEAIKPLEDAERAYIIRLYEAEGTHTTTKMHFNQQVKHLALTNMLEEITEELPISQELSLTFRAFEIKTIKVCY
ncbi:MAG: alpha-mannosidase [Epulopiscium sp.]|nr:alpha-mannosidase [Candidatus Epulonipiscium sp.]